MGAPPLVLLHGGSATAAVWYANIAALSRTHRVHAVDRIGEAGRSLPGPRQIRRVADLTAWLDGVLDGLGLDDTDLCAHSYGAWIALTYALRSPERVRRLVLLDPTQCFAGFRPGYLLRALPMLARPTAARALAFLDWETGGAVTDPAHHTLHGLAAEYPAAKVVTGRRPRGRDLTVPTLVLLAEQSRTHDSRRVAAAVERLGVAEVGLLPGVSHHGLPFTGAAELDRRITAFLGAAQGGVTGRVAVTRKPER
ncbi:alpha/beta fold hydrolase [Kitasatospora sp. McL0602]|uniref:alpha/beta fold hydrolase n=1 Tax=Kitasatospora sp. McL0602 TaxID=3439530 RepID=UPI003F8B9447